MKHKYFLQAHKIQIGRQNCGQYQLIRRNLLVLVYFSNFILVRTYHGNFLLVNYLLHLIFKKNLRNIKFRESSYSKYRLNIHYEPAIIQDRN